jgi:hypothetical protein
MSLMDDDRYFPRDLATLLPFVCELIPSIPEVMLMPNSEQYLGEKASDSIGNRDAISEGDQ